MQYIQMENRNSNGNTPSQRNSFGLFSCSVCSLFSNTGFYLLGIYCIRFILAGAINTDYCCFVPNKVKELQVIEHVYRFHQQNTQKANKFPCAFFYGSTNNLVSLQFILMLCTVLRFWGLDFEMRLHKISEMWFPVL